MRCLTHITLLTKCLKFGCVSYQFNLQSPSLQTVIQKWLERNERRSWCARKATISNLPERFHVRLFILHPRKTAMRLFFDSVEHHKNREYSHICESKRKKVSECTSAELRFSASQSAPNFAPAITNLTNVHFPPDELALLKKGGKCS